MNIVRIIRKMNKFVDCTGVAGKKLENKFKSKNIYKEEKVNSIKILY